MPSSHSAIANRLLSSLPVENIVAFALFSFSPSFGKSAVQGGNR